jgi:hypothetical protein
MSHSIKPDSGRPVVMQTGGLRLTFERTGDRYRHAIGLTFGEETILESVEGAPEEFWPPSPPLQELQLQSCGPRQVALGVGMAGSSHWSLSALLVASDEPGVVARAEFDLACRTLSAEMELRTTYAMNPSLHAAASGECMVIGLGGQGRRLIILPETCSCSVGSPERILFAPRDISSSRPVTVRWRYALALCEG